MQQQHGGTVGKEEEEEKEKVDVDESEEERFYMLRRQEDSSYLFIWGDCYNDGATRMAIGVPASDDSYHPPLERPKLITKGLWEETGLPQLRIAQVLCNGSYTLLRTVDGRLLQAGYIPGDARSFSTFKPYLTEAEEERVGRVFYVASGNYHTFVLTHHPALAEATPVPESETDRSLYAWGRFTEGQLACGYIQPKGTRADLRFPRLVEPLLGLKVVQVDCGDYHSIFLTSEGCVYTAGRDHNGQLGLGSKSKMLDTTLPHLVTTLISTEDQVVQVAAGAQHNAVLTQKGKVFTWGNGLSGQLGIGCEVSCPIPQTVTSLDHLIIVAVSCGSHFTAALTERGDVLTWGTSAAGQLGHGDYESQLLPKFVEAVRGKATYQISCGALHMAAIGLSGDIWMWGNSGAKQSAELYIVLSHHYSTTQVSCGVCYSASWKGPLPAEVQRIKDCVASFTTQVSLSRDLQTLVDSTLNDLLLTISCTSSKQLLHIHANAAILYARCPYFREQLQSFAVDPCKAFSVATASAFSSIPKSPALELSLEVSGDEAFVTNTVLANLKAVYTATSFTDSKDITLKFFQLHTPVSQLANDLSSCLTTPVFADVKFLFPSAASHPEECTQSTPSASTPLVLYAHKAILCARSKYFYTMFLAGLRETSDDLLTIEIAHIRPQVYQAMLYFLYTGTIPGCGMEGEEGSTSKDSPLVESLSNILVELVVAADEYILIALKHQCLQLIEGSLEASNFMDMWQFAALYNAKELKVLCLNFLCQNFQRKELQDVLRENAELRNEVIRRFWNNTSDGFAVSCAACSATFLRMPGKKKPPNWDQETCSLCSRFFCADCIQITEKFYHDLYEFKGNEYKPRIHMKRTSIINNKTYYNCGEAFKYVAICHQCRDLMAIYRATFPS